MPNKKARTNTLRIIGGQWRGRKLSFPPGDGLRPTPDRIRETLFNWLQNKTANIRVLDLFAGSGALGLEALSRGAGSATFIEANPEAARSIKEHLKTLNCSDSQVINADVLTTLESHPPQQSYHLVLLDPPFRQHFIEPCIKALEQQHWLTDEAWIYIESEKELTQLPLPPNWNLYRSKQAGQVAYRLIRHQR